MNRNTMIFGVFIGLAIGLFAFGILGAMIGAGIGAIAASMFP